MKKLHLCNIPNLLASLYLDRYQAELSEDSSLDKSEPFTVGGALCPPSQGTPRTSRNVSILTIATGNSHLCPVYFILYTDAVYCEGLLNFPLLLLPSCNLRNLEHLNIQGYRLPTDTSMVEFTLCFCVWPDTRRYCITHLETATEFSQSCFHGMLMTHVYAISDLHCQLLKNQVLIL